MDTKIFDQPDPKLFDVKNHFDLGNFNQVTINPGYLVPVYSQYCIPGLEVDYGTDVYGRLMPLINPIYSKYKFFVYNFFVPTRLVFPHFDRFRAGKKVSDIDGHQYSPLAPRISLYYMAFSSCWQLLVDALQGTGTNINLTLQYIGIWTNSLPDYLNFPCTNEISFNNNPHDIGQGIELIDNCLLPLNPGSTFKYFHPVIDGGSTTTTSYFEYSSKGIETNLQGCRLVFIEEFIAYTLIWYDYFRDWRLEDYTYSPYDYIKQCSDEHENNYNYYYDTYYPAQFCTQHEQLNWFALRRRTFTSDMFVSAFPTPQLGDAMNIPQLKDFQLSSDVLQNSNLLINGTMVTANTSGGYVIPKFNFENGKGATIDDLHFAESFQKYYQILMVHGINTSELDKIFYGVYSTKPYDKPIFIDGDTFDFNFDEVLQTSQTTETSPLGDFAGRGSLFGNHNGNRKFVTDEFGTFITLVCAVPRQAYFQGIPRKFTRKWDVYDLPNALFAHLGFDNVQEEELYFTVTDNSTSAASVYALNKRDFGYITRYIDQRVHNDEIHGSFRSTLSNWHTARIFDEAPTLSPQFTAVNHWDFARVFAVQQFSHPNILLLVRNKFNCTQNLPYYCNPF